MHGHQNNKGRIPAFTIQELIIVLVISSMLMSMAYFSYHAIHQYYNKYKKQSNEILEVYRFLDIFENDVEKAQYLNATNNKFVIRILDKKIQYEFHESDIVRKSLSNDTFSFINYCPKVVLQEPTNSNNLSKLSYCLGENL